MHDDCDCSSSIPVLTGAKGEASEKGGAHGFIFWKGEMRARRKNGGFHPVCIKLYEKSIGDFLDPMDHFITDGRQKEGKRCLLDCKE